LGTGTEDCVKKDVAAAGVFFWLTSTSVALEMSFVSVHRAERIHCRSQRAGDDPKAPMEKERRTLCGNAASHPRGLRSFHQYHSGFNFRPFKGGKRRARSSSLPPYLLPPMSLNSPLHSRTRHHFRPSPYPKHHYSLRKLQITYVVR